MTGRSLVAVMLGVVLAAWFAGQVWAASGVAVASAAAGGDLGLVVALHHSAEGRERAFPAPIVRPAVYSRLVIGLPGVLDLAVGGRFGPRLGMAPSARAEWDAWGGLRLAPVGIDGTVRLEVVASGGLRSVPGNGSSRGGLYEGYRYWSASEAVAVVRLDSLVALQPRSDRPAMLGRFRYENHWITEITTTRSASPKSCMAPAIASHLWEARLGLLISPHAPRSFLVECGFYIYHPVREDQLTPHTGLVLLMGGALGPGETATVP